MLTTIYFCIAVLILGFIITSYIRKQYKKSHSRQLLTFCPNVWTSLGILGTFVSIVISLGSTTDFREITELINQISPAFWTSIEGISLSIISSIRIKKQLAIEDLMEQRQYEKATNETPEITLANLLKENKNNGEKLNNIFNLIKDQLDKLNQRAEKNFGEEGTILKTQRAFINEVKKEIENNKTNAKTNKDDINNKIDELKISIDGKLDKIFKDVNYSLKENGSIQKCQEETLNKFNEQNQKIEKFLQDLVDKLEGFYNNVLIGTQDSTTKLIEQHIVDYKELLDKYSKELGTQATTLLESHKNALEEQQNHIIAASEQQFENIHSQYQGTCDSLTTTFIAKLNDVCSKMETTIKNMLEKSDTLDQMIAQHSDEVKQRMTEESTKMTELSAEIQGSVKASNSTLANSIQETNNALKSKIEEMASAITDATNAFNTSIEAIQIATIEQLTKVSDDNKTKLQSVSESTKNTIVDLTKDMAEKTQSDLINSLSQIVEELKNESLSIISVYEDFKNQATKLSSDIKAGIESNGTNLVNSITSTNAQLSEKIAEMSQNVESATNEFKEDVKELKDSTTASLENISQETKSGINTIASNTESAITTATNDISTKAQQEMVRALGEIVMKLNLQTTDIVDDINKFKAAISQKHITDTDNIYNELNTRIQELLTKLSTSITSETQQVTKSLSQNEALSNQIIELLGTLKAENGHLKLIVEKNKDQVDTVAVLKSQMGTFIGDLKKLLHQFERLADKDLHTVDVIDGKKTCPNCQHENSSDARYCTECGCSI